MGVFDRKDNTIELYPPKYYLFNTVKFIPTLYSTDWYIEPQGYEDTEQYLGMSDISNAPQEIVTSRNSS